MKSKYIHKIFNNGFHLQNSGLEAPSNLIEMIKKITNNKGFTFEIYNDIYAKKSYEILQEVI